MPSQRSHSISPPQKRPFLSNLLCHCKKVADIFSKTRPFYCEGSQTISGTRTSFRSARVAVLILPSIQRLNLYVGQCQWCLPLGLIQIISTATGPLFCKLSLYMASLCYHVSVPPIKSATNSKLIWVLPSGHNRRVSPFQFRGPFQTARYFMLQLLLCLLTLFKGLFKNFCHIFRETSNPLLVVVIHL